MSNALPLSFSVARLDETRKYTPPQLADAIVAGLRAIAQQQFALFVAGSTEPANDVGPWAKNGNLWQSFDYNLGRYVDFLITDGQRKYVISAQQPNVDDAMGGDSRIVLWLEITSAGEPVGWRVRSTDPNTDAITWPYIGYPRSEVYTKTEVNALLAAVAATAVRHSARVHLSLAQAVPADGTDTKINFDVENFDVSAAFDVLLSRYKAPVKGIYRIEFSYQIDNIDAVASGMQVVAFFAKASGGGSIAGGAAAVASPPGDRWFPASSNLVQLNANDEVEAFLEVISTGGTGSVNISTNSVLCFSLVEPIA